MQRHRALGRRGYITLAVALAWRGLSAALCDLAVTGIAFSDYGPLDGGHRDSIGEIHVSCQGAPGQLVAYRVRLSSGTRGAFSPRGMRGAIGTLTYNLFRNAARSRLWGDGNSGTEMIVGSFTISSSGGPVMRKHSVYARIFARQDVRPGTYTDLVQVTVEVCDSLRQCDTQRAPLAVR